MNQWEERIRRRMADNAFMHYTHIEIQEVEQDRAAVALTLRPEHRNPFGIVHGGVLYTMADNAAGCAVHTDGRGYVTQNGQLHFLRPAREGTLRAEAAVRRRGRATALIQVDITDEGGRLLATGEFSFYCIAQEGGSKA